MARTTSTDSNITIEIRGYNRVRNNLRSVIAAHPKETDEVMRVWAEDTRMLLKRTPYPAKPANSRYIRTGKLASSWRKDRIKPGVWIIANNARGPKGRFYARYVVGVKDGAGDQRQAWMHRNRWWNADEVIEQQRIPELRNGLEERFIELWNE